MRAASTSCLIRLLASGERPRVRVSGEIAGRAAPVLLALMRRICGEAWEIELDLRGVSFIDSAGLGALLDAKAICAEHDVALMLIPSEPHPQRRASELAGINL